MNLGITIAVTLFLGIFYGWTSRLNGIFFFGRSLSPDLRASDEARAITRSYLISVIGATSVALALSGFLYVSNQRLIAIGPLFLWIGFTFIFAHANRRASALQMTVPASAHAVVQVDLAQPPTYRIPGWTMVLIPLALAAVLFTGAVFTEAHGLGYAAGWEGLNRHIEAHRLDGLFGMSLGLLTSATLLLSLLKTSVRLRTRMAQYSVRASLSLQWIGVALLGTVFAISVSGLSVSLAFGRGVMIGAMLGTVVLMIWNQRRSREFVPPAAELGSDDRWRWGLFYVDKGDPALFVQSRCGAGYTLNYGRALAWPIALTMLAYFVGMLFLAPHHI